MNKRASMPSTPAQSLTDLAYAHLEELIVTLKLAPGAAVSEAELSELTGIGRTPIREALQRLSCTLEEQLGRMSEPEAKKLRQLVNRRWKLLA